MAGKTDHGHHKGEQAEHDGARETGHDKKEAKSGTQEAQDGPCCELSCVTFAVIATNAIEIVSPHGQRHFAAVAGDRDGVELFELMRPPRA